MDPLAKTLNRQIGKRICKRICDARILCGLSQEQLGKMMGISFQQVQKYEKGLNGLSPPG